MRTERWEISLYCSPTCPTWEGVVRVVVDPDRCEGNARCLEAAPGVFELGDDDQAHVILERPSEEQRTAVERAVRVCPRQAISIVDDN